MIWKRLCVAAPASRWVESSPQQIWPWPCNLDLQSLTLTLATLHLDLQPRRWCLGPWSWTAFSDTRLKTSIFTFLTLVALTFDLWPWPSKIWCSLICVPNFRVAGPTVQPAECKQTGTHTGRQTLPLTREVKMFKIFQELLSIAEG